MNEIATSSAMAKKIEGSWWLLKLVYGITAIIVGLDKFFNIVTFWPRYVSQVLVPLLPLPIEHVMYVVGVIEILVGLLILSKYTKWGAYILAAWLGIIILNLLSMGVFYDIAARDAVMAAGALVLAQLTDVVNYLRGSSLMRR